jgi:hypothetical protein
MRSTSLTFRQAINAQETEQVFIILVEISGTGMDTIRVCSGGESISSNGNDYIYYPFSLDLPSDEAEDVPQAKMTIDNVDQSLIEAIRTLARAPSVRIMVVLASDPNQVEVDFSDFIFTDITYDALTISGTISVENFMSEPFPGDYIVPSNFISLF